MKQKRLFGYTKEGKEAKRYLLANKNGMEVEVSDFGATILTLKVPDKDGNLIDVMLG